MQFKYIYIYLYGTETETDAARLFRMALSVSLLLIPALTASWRADGSIPTLRSERLTTDSARSRESMQLSTRDAKVGPARKSVLFDDLCDGHTVSNGPDDPGHVLCDSLVTVGSLAR